MSHQLRSELLKLRTTRTLAVSLLAAGVMSLFGVSVGALSRDLDRLAPEEGQRDHGGDIRRIGVAYDGSLEAEAALHAAESVQRRCDHWRVLRHSRGHPRRHERIPVRDDPADAGRRAAPSCRRRSSKLAAAALAGIAFAVICVALAFGAGIAVLAARDVEVALTGAHPLVLSIGPIVASLLSAMVGVAVGTLIRNQAGAIVALAAYALLVDAVLFAALPSVGRYLPGKAGDALAGRPDELLLAPGLGAAVLSAWALLFLAAATVRNDHSDV